MNKVLSTVFIFCCLFFLSFSGFAQNITLAQVTGGVSASPLPSNATDRAILGFSLAKAGGGTSSVSAISISLTENPTGRFTNPRLYKSNDNSFGPADLAAVTNPLGTGAFVGNAIEITGAITDFGGGSGAAGPEFFFVVVDIDNSVNPATLPVIPSLASTDINALSTVNPGSITGTSYSFTDASPPGITFAPAGGSTGFPLADNITITFNEPVRKTDASPLVDADLAALVEFKLTSNAGATVPFTATINVSKTVITINPTASLTSGTVYYVEINPIEDGSGNTTTATNITFTSLDNTPPQILSFAPADGATGVVETSNIIITFDEAVRLISDGAIDPTAIQSLVELRLTNSVGALVAFTGSIDVAKKVITIDPTLVLAGNTTYFVKINSVEDASNNATASSSITFTTGDTLPPSLTFNPSGGTNASASGNIVITFSDPIRKTNDSPVTPADIEAGLVELKLTSNGGAAVPFTATINVANTIITINPNATLAPSQLYYVEVNPIEDDGDNATSAENITFTTENLPSITSFTPPGGICIGDNITVTGVRFTGTGNPLSGNTQPTVSINGVALLAAAIVSFSTTEVIFTVPATATTGPITIRNNDSNLLSANSSNLNVFPAIDTTLPVTPSSLNPAQNTSVIFSVDNTQNSFTYRLISNSDPVGYTATTQNTTGDGGTKTLTTTPSLDVIGAYTYRIDVLRTGCATKTLANTPVTVTVASLLVSASATSTNVCSGNSIILIGSASGGTGFYQFRWTSDPAGYNSTASSPTVTPTANIKYILEVEDNAGNTISDFVDIVVNPGTTAAFAPAPGETSVRTNYTLENNDFRLYGAPAGGVFAGSGVTLKNDGFYYFNPFNAGVGTKVLTYTYTDPNGCQAVDSETFTVSNFSINNLKEVYCKAENTQTNLNLNLPNSGVTLNGSNGWQFSRLIFYNGGCYINDLATGNCGFASPLTLTSSQNVTPFAVGFSATIPSTYSMDLSAIRSAYGFSYEQTPGKPAGKTNYFYILVYGKNALGVENLRSFQFFKVVDNGPAPSIVGINEKGNICSDATAITLSSSISGYAVNQFTITPSYAAGSLSGTVGETFNPGHSSLTENGKAEEPLTIKLDYKDKNNCPASVITNFNWVGKPGAPIASDVEFCQVIDGVAAKYIIKGDPNPAELKSNPLWYDASAPSVVLDSIRWDFIAPGVTGLTPLVKTYLVQQEFKGCKSSTTSVDLEIKPAPGAAFVPGAICQGKDFNLTGPVDTGLSQPYEKYEWNFGDRTATETQIVSDDPAITYNYESDGNYNIRLTVTNNRGCENSEVRSITVGLNPKPTFEFNQVCEGNQTEFFGSADIGVTQYAWDFGDNSPGKIITKGNSGAAVPGPNNGTYQNPIHRFILNPSNASGDYDVTITSFTNIGCFSSVTRVVTILDTLTRSTSNPYNMAAQGGGNGLWRVEDINGNSTWEFAVPTTPLMKKFTSEAWVTNADGFYSQNEKSFLNSPCFNIENIARPVISMDMILDTDRNIEGAVLEYSRDNGENWLPLGLENSGLNWFNTTGFRIGNIGNSPVGWSGDSINLDDKNILVQARRALDNLGNLLTKNDRSNVRFRVAFATTADAKSIYEGFGFNNLTISARDRISLVETFTNVNADGYAGNNIAFKIVPNEETAKIQYHVSYPDEDENASVNKADPASRAAYYGIPLSDQYVPRSYVDGLSGGVLNDGLEIATWAKTRFSKQSLKNSDYNLKIESLDSPDDSYFKIKVTVEAKIDIPSARNHILHIAVVEKVVGNNEYVLRKLVPDANGTILPAMNLTDSEEVIHSIQLENKNIDANQLALVAFVQDQITRDIYQASLDINPLFKPTLITGIKQLLIEQINIYPNPASWEFRVELPAIVENDMNLHLIDQVGRKHEGGLIRAGSNTATVNVENLSGGVYILEIGSASTGILRKKIMVVMKN